MDWIAVLPDIQPTGYPAIFKTVYWISGGCRIPDIRPDILPDTGYFNASLLFDRVSQIIETSQIFKQSKNVLLISGLPDIQPGYSETALDIWYLARYWIAEQWLDFIGY